VVSHVRLLSILLGIMISAIAQQPTCGDDREPLPSPRPIDFAHQIAPLLTERCVSCHNAGQAKGGLDLTSTRTAYSGGDSGPAIVPGKPDESLLLEMISLPPTGGRAEMPKKGGPLSAEEVALIRQWIAEGASWPEGHVLRERVKADLSWWSLQPVNRAMRIPNPPGLLASWATNPIDRFVFAKLVEKGLRPSPPAERRTLMRRVSYDLTGLPPTIEDVESFVRDERADAYERLVERMLASPHYGERWGRHWLDIVRFGESRGFERNEIINNAWPFRDYVIRSFNQDKPFPRFILEQLAGDVIGKDNPDVEVGTAFLVTGPYDDVGNQDEAQAKQIRANTLDDIITATGTAFLGMTIHCARCHDHKFDAIPQADYYRLQATFAGVTHGDREIATRSDRRRSEERARTLAARIKALSREKTTLEDAIVQRAELDAHGAEPEYKRPSVDPHFTEDRFAPVTARYVRLTALSSDRNPDSPAGVRIDEFEVWTSGADSKNVALASEGARAEGASRVADDFAEAYAPGLTIDGKFDAAWIAPLDPRLTITLARPCAIDRIVFSSDRLRAFPGRHAYSQFVGEYVIEVSLGGRTWTKVADSSARPPINETYRRKRLLRDSATVEERQRLEALGKELAEVEQQLEAVRSLPRVWAGEFKEPKAPSYLMKGGDPSKVGPTIAPAGLDVLSRAPIGYSLAPDAPEAERRLALGRWIGSDDNPLTARVLVNRIWHYHFGTGIVDTPSDFGALGGRPTHPELLDWLAGRLIEHGWRLKPLHREIVLSQAYRQSSASNDASARVDASARYLWRFPPRRLSAEEIRDTILGLAEKLDLRMGGPGFRLYRYLSDNVSTYVALDVAGSETFRRAVYHQNARASRVDLLSDFDCPDNSAPAPSRAAITTPLQALTMMNHRFIRDMAQAFADRLEREAGPDDPAGQVRRGFALAFARRPDAAEEQSATELIRRYGLPAFCRALLNSSELIYLD
jgi:hypothetical protein